MEQFYRDLQIAARAFRSGRSFSAVAIATFAVCIGANTAIYSIVYALLLRPLPFSESARIVEIYNTFPKTGLNKLPSNLVQYSDYKNNTQSYEAVGLWGLSGTTVGETGAEERIMAAYCTPEMFQILGISPIIGHFFTLENCRFGEEKVIVLTESFWRSYFNGDPEVLGKRLRIDGDTFQIIGVAPKTLEAFDARVRFIQPWAWKPEWIKTMSRFGLNTPLYGRLKSNVSVERALVEATALEQRVYDTAPPRLKAFLDRTGHRIAIGEVQSERVKSISSSLYLLQGGVIIVLLIGCLNVVNMFLSRANARQGEFAMRLALGASRIAIARQLIVETFFLTLIGAGVGVCLALEVIHVANGFSARMLPNILPFAIDARTLGFTLMLSIFVSLLVAILPIAHVVRADLSESIQRTWQKSSRNRTVQKIGNIIVAAQLAVALMLLIGAGLLIHSFANALEVDAGFDPENMLTSRIALPALYQKDSNSAIFQRRLVEALKEIPGTADIALASSVPFQGVLNAQGVPKVNAVTLKESPLQRDAAQHGAYQVGVSSGYFKALHIQLLDGRFFEDKDDGSSGQVYVVDERFAQLYFPGRSAVGAHFTFGSPPVKDSDWPVIIGVVRNVPHNGVEDKSNLPFSYYSLVSTRPEVLSIFVRSQRPIGDLISAIRTKLQSVDPAIPLFDTQALQTVIFQSLDNRRSVMLLLSAFSVIALFLSALGVYGVISYDLSQRTREIGIRGAIGATRVQILRLIMWQGLKKTIFGLIAGLIGAVLIGRYIEAMLFKARANDPWAYFFVSLVLGMTAAAASYIPARRAARINPMEALRTE